jgi:hypothetical protein
MKLLFCPLCRDVQGLIMQTWRCCLCGKSGGQYNADGMTATLGGEARVFGVGNPFFEYLYPFLEEKGKRAMWKKYYGHELGDCWWGEYEGDNQVLRILDVKGPRLKLKVVNLQETGPDRILTESGTNHITVIDKRQYMFLGKWYTKGIEEDITFQVPANQRVKLTRWGKHGKKKGRDSTTTGK